ncbi:MAG: hypothetical protein IJA10_07105 [Lachnospiraceae bacterium]|nr:hypothetical protein [Lachnospiraceae bacterium]
MNNENWKEARERGKNLLIVEGNHEKNELFGLIFKCFPEINIDMEDVWIYGTNIYILYEDIIKEYEADWDEQDIDLPYVISKKNRNNIQYKNDFTNIILVFDYEHHDPNFDEEKILKMQRYFGDSADVGKLYINYPMIESYQHLESIPDIEYKNRQISVTLQPGVQYKNKVKNTVVAKSVDLVRKMREILVQRFEVMDNAACNKCVDELLLISNSNNVITAIEGKLNNVVEQKYINTARYQFADLLSKFGYMDKEYSYWNYMREMFKQIVIHNICKANKVQNGLYQISCNEYKQCFQQLDLDKILQIQNEVSRDVQNGYIWVLNTCVFVIADYNFSLVLADK